MSTHTPGPFETFKGEGFTAVLPELLDSEVNSLANGGDDIAQCYGPDQEANARLFAAAPDLLAALIETHEQAMRWIYDARGMDGLAEEWSINARAAITKATGGQP